MRKSAKRKLAENIMSIIRSKKVIKSAETCECRPTAKIRRIDRPKKIICRLCGGTVQVVGTPANPSLAIAGLKPQLGRARLGSPILICSMHIAIQQNALSTCPIERVSWPETKGTSPDNLQSTSLYPSTSHYAAVASYGLFPVLVTQAPWSIQPAASNTNRTS